MIRECIENGPVVMNLVRRIAYGGNRAASHTQVQPQTKFKANRQRASRLNAIRAFEVHPAAPRYRRPDHPLARDRHRRYTLAETLPQVAGVSDAEHRAKGRHLPSVASVYRVLDLRIGHRRRAARALAIPRGRSISAGRTPSAESNSPGFRRIPRPPNAGWDTDCSVVVVVHALSLNPHAGCGTHPRDFIRFLIFRPFRTIS